MKFLAAAVCFCFLTFTSGANAQALSTATHASPAAAELAAKLSRYLNDTAASFGGVIGVFVKDLRSGQTFTANADVVFPQASSIKIAILIELFRQAEAGRQRLDERIEVTRSQMVGGSGVLQDFAGAGSALSLCDLAVLMIVLSDNTATNILIDRVGMENVNAALQHPGLTHTRLERRMMDVAAEKENRENLSTPREMAALLELLEEGKLLDREHTAAALQILQYPKETPLRASLPESVPVADKHGELPGVRCDSGIVFLPSAPYVISVMTADNMDDAAAARAISEISLRVFEYFDRLAHSNAYGVRIP
jgi:beta-lactamase class A